MTAGDALVRCACPSRRLVDNVLRRIEAHVVQRIMVTNQEPLEQVAEIRQEMPTVSDLNNIWRSLPRTIFIPRYSR